MGISVTATEAAQLVDRSERIVRERIYQGQLAAEKLTGAGKAPRWRIDVDQLTLVPGWRVDRDRLAALEAGKRNALGGPTGLLTRLDHLERQVVALVGVLEGLRAEMRSIDTARQEVIGTLIELEEQDEAALAPPSVYRGPATVTLRDRGPSVAREFATLTDAARWLERHGVNASTAKGWRGWRHVERTPSGVLRLALTLQQEAQAAGNWRVAWRLRRCGDPACVCVAALEPSAS